MNGIIAGIQGIESVTILMNDEWHSAVIDFVLIPGFYGLNSSFRGLKCVW